MHAEPAFLEEALTKLRRGAPHSVAAVFVGEVASENAAGVRWRTFVTDGNDAGFVDAEPAVSLRLEPGMEVPPTHIERQVEYVAGQLTPESRLEELLASSPVVIPL